jgi:hypothetical protein
MLTTHYTFRYAKLKPQRGAHGLHGCGESGHRNASPFSGLARIQPGAFRYALNNAACGAETL